RAGRGRGDAVSHRRGPGPRTHAARPLPRGGPAVRGGALAGERQFRPGRDRGEARRARLQARRQQGRVRGHRTLAPIAGAEGPITFGRVSTAVPRGSAGAGVALALPRAVPAPPWGGRGHGVPGHPAVPPPVLRLL